MQNGDHWGWGRESRESGAGRKGIEGTLDSACKRTCKLSTTAALPRRSIAYLSTAILHPQWTFGLNLDGGIGVRHKDRVL
jgi:hypothetical protein